MGKAKRNKTKEKGLIIGLYCGILGLGGTYATLHAVHVYDETEMLDWGMITAECIQHPLVIFPLTPNENLALICILALAMILGLMAFNNYIREKDVMKQDAKGGGKWNKDYKGYNDKYSDAEADLTHEKKKTKELDSSAVVESSNMIMSQQVRLSMHDFDTQRNCNVLVVGGSGSGKSRYVIKPNMLQANCSFVVTDPSGELLRSHGMYLKSMGYKVKIFNLSEMNQSDCYNPFEYIRDDLGVKTLINCLIKNTTPPGSSKGDPFWEKSEEAILSAIIGYLRLYCPKKKQNFTSVMELLQAAEVNENDPEAKSKLDKLFDEVEAKDPTSIALKSYKTFKLGGAKTLKSILISAAVRLDIFNYRKVKNLTCRDTIGLTKMGDEKSALFIIIPTADTTFNFLAAMMYSQLFETLYYHAEHECGGRLTYPVRFMLDEFANIGEIPNFNEKLATIRKYGMSCTIVLQSVAQIKKMYEKDYQSLIGNCDSTIFLGSSEDETAKWISDKLGKGTIKYTGDSSSKSGNSRSINQDGRALMEANEISYGKFKNDECMVFVRAEYPFRDAKFNYPEHPEYYRTGDANKANQFINTLDNSSVPTMDELRRYSASQRLRDAFRGAKLAVSKAPVEELAKKYRGKTAEEIAKCLRKTAGDARDYKTGGINVDKMEDATENQGIEPVNRKMGNPEGKKAPAADKPSAKLGLPGTIISGLFGKPRKQDVKPGAAPAPAQTGATPKPRTLPIRAAQKPRQNASMQSLGQSPDSATGSTTPASIRQIPQSSIVNSHSGIEKVKQAAAARRMETGDLSMYINLVNEALDEKFRGDPCRVYQPKIPADKVREVSKAYCDSYEVSALILTDTPEDDGSLIGYLHRHTGSDITGLLRAINDVGYYEEIERGVFRVELRRDNYTRAFNYLLAAKQAELVHDGEEIEDAMMAI